MNSIDDFKNPKDASDAANTSDGIESTPSDEFEKLTSDQQQHFDEFLSNPNMQSRMSKFFVQKERTEFGIVNEVDHHESGHADVHYFNEDGLSTIFVYNPEIYPEAPSGYSFGDVIAIHYLQGQSVPESVTPINLDNDKRTLLLNQIRSKRK